VPWVADVWADSRPSARKGARLCPRDALPNAEMYWNDLLRLPRAPPVTTATWLLHLIGVDHIPHLELPARAAVAHGFFRFLGVRRFTS
jgi:hypothetical protein